MKPWPHVNVLAGSLALLMLSLAVPYVSTAPPTPEPADAGLLRAPESNPKRGGVLKWGGLANSTLYDLHQTGTIGNMGPQAPMYDLLVQVDPVHWDKVIPDLAQSWTISEDGLTYTFSLREGVTFHDGAPLTAEGVVRKLERNPDYWNPALPYLDGIDIYHLEPGPKTGAACLAHTVDYCFAIDPMSEQKAQKIRGLHTARIYPHAPHGLWFNLKKKPFDDVRVRKAMNLVVDKAALVDATQDFFPQVRAGWLLPTESFFQEYWGKVQ